MTISVMDDDGWGESVEGYQWSDAGDELLIRFTESLRVYSVQEGVTERGVQKVDLGEVLDIGWAAGDWWTVAKRDGSVVFRQGLEGQDVPLEGSAGWVLSTVTVSPDGQTVAGTVKGPKLVFWSASNGKRLFSIRIETKDPHPLGGNIDIDSICWSPDSRCLAVQPGFPVADLMVIDVRARRVLE